MPKNKLGISEMLNKTNKILNRRVLDNMCENSFLKDV